MIENIKRILPIILFIVAFIRMGLVLILTIASINSAHAGDYSKAIYLVLLTILFNMGNVSAFFDYVFLPNDED